MSAERVAIIGSGTIACGLAATVATADDVLLWARSGASAARGAERVAKLCERLECASGADRLTVTTSIEEIGDRSFVIEAISEDMPSKRAIVARMDACAGSDAVLATTTSSLSVSTLASASGRPDRFVGFHVFHPVAQMKLTELVFPGAATEATRERARALCARLGKHAVEAPDQAGFVVNRLLFPYLFSAVTFAERSGMSAADVDACMVLGAGHPMGPLALLDFVGLDVAIAIGESLQIEVPASLRELVAAGALGRKSGRGLYDYDH